MPPMPTFTPACLDQRANWINSSAYHLDVADVLIGRKPTALGLRVLSNLVEMDLQNRAILRILGCELLQAGQSALAVPLFEQVRDLAPFEPQFSRDLGLACAEVGEQQKAADALTLSQEAASAAMLFSQTGRRESGLKASPAKSAGASAA